MERYILKQALVVHHVSVNPFSLSLSYLLPLLATLKTEIDRVCRLAIHTQRRFFSLAQKVHHLTQLPAIPLQTQVFFFPMKVSGTKQKAGMDLFDIILTKVHLSLSYSFHSVNLK